MMLMGHHNSWLVGHDSSILKEKKIRSIILVLNITSICT